MEESFEEGPRVVTLLQLLQGGDPMVRDEDLIKAILMEMEAHPDPIYVFPLTMSMSIEDRTKYFHLRLLADEGMVEETGAKGGLFRITSRGYDLLNVMRNDTVWAKVRGIVSGMGAVSLTMLKDVGLAVVRQAVKDMGVPLD